MSSIATISSETRRNRFSLRHFAALVAFALLTVTLARPASAETCATAFANWSTGSRLVHSVTSSSSYANEIDEWDSDVVKIRHNIAGLLIFGAKGVAVEGTLYVWDAVNEEADPVGTADQVYGGGSGHVFSTSVGVGDYCFEVSKYLTDGYFELNINFLDGCTLGTLPSNECP